ncbi:hypothetical protein Trydic_g21575 [Trypoxylus dichotomus]
MAPKNFENGGVVSKEVLLQWAAESDDLPSGESDNTAENECIENPNFELVSGEYSRSSSDDDDDNSDDDGYIPPSFLLWSLEPHVKNKIAPHNIIRQVPGLLREHMGATPKKKSDSAICNPSYYIRSCELK